MTDFGFDPAPPVDEVAPASVEWFCSRFPVDGLLLGSAISDSLLTLFPNAPFGLRFFFHSRWGLLDPDRGLSLMAGRLYGLRDECRPMVGDNPG